MKNISIKVCGMKYQENIAALCSLHPDYMGFIFYEKSPRYVIGEISAVQLKAIDPYIKKVGVFVNASVDEIAASCKIYEIKIVQLHGEESPQICSVLKNKGFQVIKAFSMTDEFDFSTLEPYKKVCDFFLFDTKGNNYGGTGKNFNWDILSRYDNAVPFFLSGGIDVDNIKGLNNLTSLNIHALDINSKFEISPGLKDIEKIKLFKEQLNALPLFKI